MLHATKLQMINEIEKHNLSVGQKGLWFLSELGGSAQSVYNESLIYELEGQLSIPALQAAIAALIEKHEVLRAGFQKTEEGQPYQTIAKTAPIKFQVIEY